MSNGYQDNGIKDRESFPTLSNKAAGAHLVFCEPGRSCQKKLAGAKLEKRNQSVHVSRFLGQKILQKMAGMPKRCLKKTIARNKSGEALRSCGFPNLESVQRGLEQLGIVGGVYQEPRALGIH